MTEREWVHSMEKSLDRAEDEIRRLEAENEKLRREIDSYESGRKERSKRIEEAIDLVVRYGGIDGDHHKAWVLDQVVRTLTGSKYEEIVREAKDGEDGPETYSWDEGIPP